MDQKERRTYLLNYLLAENPQAGIGRIPDDEKEQKALLRGLMNIRMPQPVSSDFLTVQDAYLKEEIASDGIVEMADLVPLQSELYLWQGDITRLKCDAVVNAANSRMLGSCYHSCLELAEENGAESIAFCCISTGEFHFPNDKAAEIAIKTVKEYKERTSSRIEVVFNVFKDRDKEIYRKLLTQN